MDSSETLSAPASSETVHTSFAAFNPIGHVLIGLPTQAHADTLAGLLRRAGWTPETLLDFMPRESVRDLEALLAEAGPLAGFGYEITLLRRYLELARQDYRWLLVKVDGTTQAAAAALHAQACRATLAVHYRSLVVEDLL